MPKPSYTHYGESYALDVFFKITVIGGTFIFFLGLARAYNTIF